MTILAKFLTKLRLLAERDGRVIRMAVTRNPTLAPLPFLIGKGLGVGVRATAGFEPLNNLCNLVQFFQRGRMPELAG